MLTVSDRVEMACDILKATNDGNSLSPLDLKILESAVNGCLNENGEQYFFGLHKEIMEGGYDKLKKYLHGVEHITKDHEGYVYYKGLHVEHFSFRDAMQEKVACERLAARCRMLEEKNVVPGPMTVVWHVENYLSKQELESTNYVL